MTAKECADNWRRIVEIFWETEGSTPEVAVSRIVAEIGRDDAFVVFSTIAHIKDHDGRIYGRNRNIMDQTPYVKDAVEWVSGNPMLRAGVDKIHTAHINQMIGALIGMTEA